jgi:hypothetical protein
LTGKWLMPQNKIPTYRTSGGVYEGKEFYAGCSRTLFTTTVLTSCGSTTFSTGSDQVVSIEVATTWKDSTASIEQQIPGFAFPKFSSGSKSKIAEFLNSKVNSLLAQYFEPIQQDPSFLGEYPQFDLQGEILIPVGKYKTIKISGYSFVGDANHGTPIDEYYVMDSETEEQVFISYFIPKLSNSTISSIIYRQLKMSLGFNDYLSDGIPDNLSYVSNDRLWPHSSASTNSPADHLDQVLYPHRRAGAKPGASGPGVFLTGARSTDQHFTHPGSRSGPYIGARPGLGLTLLIFTASRSAAGA